MREEGVVSREISPRLVEVSFRRSPACDKCRLCREAGEGLLAIEAVNEIGARRGEIVEIDVPSGLVVQGSLVVFVLPVVFLAAGYLAGALLAGLFGRPGWAEGAGILLGVSSLLASYNVIRWYDVNVQQKESARARVVKIVASH